MRIAAIALAIMTLTGSAVGETPGTDEAHAHWRRGVDLYAQGDGRGALDAFGQAIALRPDFAEAYTDRCIAQIEMGAADKALAADGIIDRGITDCDRAVALAPDFFSPYNARGYGYLRKNNLDRALADLNRAIALDPGSSVAYGNRASVYLKQEDNTRALADFDKAIELDPRSWKSYFLRAVIKFRMGDRTGSFEDCGKAMTLDPMHRKTLRYAEDPPDVFSCSLS